MKTVSKILFVVYLLLLLWLILFKFSYDIVGVLLYHQTSSLNLVPFAGLSPDSMREMIDNLVVFVPFGLLLGINFKHIGLWRKFAYIFAFSFAVEAAQLVFAIGKTDITDLFLNVAGGLAGLTLYEAMTQRIDAKKVDWFIVGAGIVLATALIFLRVFVLRVQY